MSTIGQTTRKVHSQQPLIEQRAKVPIVYVRQFILRPCSVDRSTIRAPRTFGLAPLSPNYFAFARSSSKASQTCGILFAFCSLYWRHVSGSRDRPSSVRHSLQGLPTPHTRASRDAAVNLDHRDVPVMRRAAPILASRCFPRPRVCRADEETSAVYGVVVSHG